MRDHADNQEAGPADEVEAFLLTREWRDGPRGVDLTFWGASAQGPVRVEVPAQEAVSFVLRSAPDVRASRRESVALRTLDGLGVDAAYFRSQRAMQEERARLLSEHVVLLESDVKPHDRFLMERFITAGFAARGRTRLDRGVRVVADTRLRRTDTRVPLSVLVLDIETDGIDGPIIAAALASASVREAYVVTERAGDYVSVHDERALLRMLFARICEIDPDLLAGWNVVEFDLTVLEARATALGVPFAIGRAGLRARILPGGRGQVSLARIPGRAVLDGIAALKNATFSFERWSLEHVSREVLGRGKLIHGTKAESIAEIRRLYREDPSALAAYNLEDCVLVLEVLEATALIELAAARARLTGLPLDRQGGAVAAFDHLYLPRLHRRGFVAPDAATEADASPSPGGHVLESRPGLFRDVLAFDFRSLYPSIIRTFGIDPLGLKQPGDDPIAGAGGATFARQGAILPAIVDELHSARLSAQAGADAALARSIKITMNSFYGVLGSPGCRFADVRLASSITRRGHEVLDRARRFFEERSLSVIYGDTDSLFVHAEALGLEEAALRAHARTLADELNATFRREIAQEHRIESHLELRVDAHYLRFLMPTMRGSDRGSKKRYAGLVRESSGQTSLVIRGLEAVRSDWTPLARETQRELLRRVFHDEPWQDWLRALREQLYAGQLDDKLAYHKRLRRELDEYENAPPHVRAARLAGEEAGGEIEYIMTLRGAEPTSARSSPIDYAHYADKQLAPACDAVLPFLETSFREAAGPQLALF